MTTTEEQLRASFRRHAEDAGTPNDLYGVVLDRCRRGRRRRVVGAAAAASALVLIAIPVTQSALDTGRGQADVASPVQAYPLPPRGPLAADEDFLATVVQAPWGRGPDALDPPLDTRQVVYAGDVGGLRWAHVVGVVDGQLTGVWLRGPVGAPGDTLTLGDEAKPVFDPEVYSFYAKGATVVFVLGRPGDRISVSERSNVDAAGTVSRDYQAVDTVDGVAAVELSPRWLPSLSIQVDRGSQTIYRGGGAGSAEFSPDDQPQTWTDQQISAAASAALGTAPNHEVARLVLEHLTDYAGYPLDELRLSVLWAGRIGDPTLGDAHAVLISAVLPSGAVAVLGGSGQLNDNAQVTTGGIQLLRLYPAGTATQDLLLVMRCDLYDGSGPTPFDSSLVILGPTGTASFRLAGAAPTDEQSADARVLIVHPGDGVTSVQALDAAGAVLADETVGGVADVIDRGEGPIN